MFKRFVLMLVSVFMVAMMLSAVAESISLEDLILDLPEMTDVETDEDSAYDGNRFLGDWISEDHGNIYVSYDGNQFCVCVKVYSTYDSDDAWDVIQWDYNCVYDFNEHVLCSDGYGLKRYLDWDDNQIGDPDYDDGNAIFRLTEDGHLIWEDQKENYADGVEYERPYGWTDYDYVGPADQFLGRWQCDRATLIVDRFTENEYSVNIEWGSSASETVVWSYVCVYNEEDMTLDSGMYSSKYIITTDETGEADLTQEYDDGNASFSLNDDEIGLVWLDKKEHVADDMLFVRLQRTAETVDGEIDVESLADGVYPAEFYIEDICDGQIGNVRIYTRDLYKAEDVLDLCPNDYIMIRGEKVLVRKIDRDSSYALVNGGLFAEDGFDMCPVSGTDYWRVSLEDDYSTYTFQGERALVLADNVEFHDNWNPDGEPLNVSGIDMTCAKIEASENSVFDVYNTEIEVKDSKIVSITRYYAP